MIEKANNNIVKYDEKTLRNKINEYKWYHTIKVADDIYTNSYHSYYKHMWNFNFNCMKNIDFKNKRVLDIGCRDGLFSFEAEKRGAKEIIGIDNDISNGATEFLIPLFKSKVRMHELNLYDLTPEKFGKFDIIIFFGVLYHLRYPFWGLKKIYDCLSDGGILLLESGMLTTKTIKNNDLLYCPFEESPYEPTSCTFFNKKGLCTTMHSLNFNLINSWTFHPPDNTKILSSNFLRNVAEECKRKFNYFVGNIKFLNVNRQFFIFKKNTQIREDYLVKSTKKNLQKKEVHKVWDGLHRRHTKRDK